MRGQLAIHLVVFAFLMVGGHGCSGSGGDAPATNPAQTSDPAPDTTAETPAAPVSDTSATTCPDWYLKPPIDATNLYAVATDLDSEAEAAFDRARQDCLKQFTSQITMNFQQLVASVQFQRRLEDDSELLARFKQALESAPELALQSVAITEQKRSEQGDIWRVCLLMELRRRAVDQAVHDVVVADDVLYAAAKQGQNFQVWEAYLNGDFDD